jgi:phospho-N-acetylmuramoyl-pentapeptide-transferase
VLVALVVVDPALATSLRFGHLPGPGQLAIVAGAIAGACLGFLWFNANPARVFMGDTGSLALGGLLGVIALSLRQELLLAVVGAIFVVEAISVMLQVYYFKYTRIRFGEGRRIFRMSPLHHHFQKCGWSETQVVVRFWMVGTILAAIGVASLRLR